MRKIVILLLALLAIRLLPRSLRAEARAMGLITLLMQSLATVMNTSKTLSLEGRVSALETRTGDLEQGKVNNLQPNTTIGQLNKGIFTNVSGGSTITMDTQQGSVGLHCGALSNFTSGPQTTFLAGLSKTQSPGGVGLDPNSGSSWANNERAQYINDLRSDWNALLGTFINNGFMTSA